MNHNSQIKEAVQNRNHLKKEDKMETKTNILKRKRKSRSYITIVLTTWIFIIGIGLLTQPFLAEARGPFGINKTPEQIIERLTVRLSLTDEQILAIQPIIEEKVQKMNEIRAERGADRQAARIEMQKLRWDTEIKFNEILTEEQIEKYLELRQEQRGKFSGGKSRGHRMGKGYNMTTEQVIERMTARFNLTGEQAAAIEPIIKESVEKKRAIFDKYGENRFEVRQAMRDEMQTVGDETETELSGILTDEQMEDLRAFRDQRREWRDKRMNRPGPMGF
jgi:hypothetical protein